MELQLKKNETGATIGKSENDSSILVPKRKRGRPRKNPVTDCNNRKISEIKEFETNVHAGTGTDDGTRGTEAKEQTAALNEEMKK